VRLHAVHANSLIRPDGGLIVGFAGGRVPYDPTAKWLYSLRLFLLVTRVEILWTTGEK
jgi:hypothetical protein